MPRSGYYQQIWFLERPRVFCASKSSKFRWQRIYDSEDFRLAFGPDLKKLEKIIPRDKKECFRYGKIDVVLAGKLISLENDLAIRNFFDRLRSSAFSAELKKNKSGEPTMLIFWGAGFGHGAGLCQQGAIAMAEAGYDYRKILKHYYPEAILENCYKVD